MYGTRDAANNWEHAHTEFMINAGFRVGNITPCLFWHADKQLVVEVHGDDFTKFGSEESLDWFKEKLHEIIEVKHQARLAKQSKDVPSQQSSFLPQHSCLQMCC